jgi:hypothetical protein
MQGGNAVAIPDIIRAVFMLCDANLGYNSKTGLALIDEQKVRLTSNRNDRLIQLSSVSSTKEPHVLKCN